MADTDLMSSPDAPMSVDPGISGPIAHPAAAPGIDWQKLKNSPLGKFSKSAIDIAADPLGYLGGIGTKVAKPYLQSAADVANQATGGAIPFLANAAQSSSQPPADQASPPPQAAPQQQAVPKTPPHVAQKALMAVGQKHGDQFTPDGLVNEEVVKNDLANLAIDKQQKEIALKNVMDLNDHLRTMNAIGAATARDMSGADYWQNQSTGGKISRVLLGILTLGGSESFIAAKIKNQVAQDNALGEQEKQRYATQGQLSDAKLKALSVDTATQGHLYMLGLDRIAAMYPALAPKIAAVKAGVQKDVSTALAGYYKQEQENKIAQYNASTSRMNAETERMKAGTDLQNKIGERQVVTLGGQTKTATIGTPKQIEEYSSAVSGARAVIRDAAELKALLSKPFATSVNIAANNQIQVKFHHMTEMLKELNGKGIRLSEWDAPLVQQMNDPSKFFTMPSVSQANLDTIIRNTQNDVSDKGQQLGLK